LPAELGRLRRLVLGVWKGPAPKQRVMPVRFLSPGHPAADRFEDFGLSQFRDQKTKGIAADDLGPDIAARTRSAINDSSQLEFAERPIHSHSRSAESLAQFRFARETLPRFVLARGDRSFEGLVNLLMLGSYFHFWAMD